MSKKKKIIIGISIAVVVLAAVGGLLFYLNSKKDKNTPTENVNKPATTEKVTIKFDTDGGEAVEDMVITKGEKIALPSTSKEGYILDGWYLNGVIVSENDTFEEDSILKAGWTKVKEDVKTFKVTFDSKGGSKVNALTVECEKALKLPKNPTKEGYTFVSWTDKKGKTIANGAKLACENITLYANWKEEKVDTPVSTDTTTVNQKQYKCSEGTLSGDKCIITKAAKMECPAGTREDGNVCVTLTDSNDGTRTCNKKYIEGHDYYGEYFKVSDAAPAVCAYAPVNSYTDKTTCENSSYKWYNNKCYKVVDIGNPSYTVTCSSGYTYYSSADLLNKFGAHNNGKCYKTQSKNAVCESGYTVSGNNCVKTVNATLE